jgi:ATP-dependent Clp protease protease subunit
VVVKSFAASLAAVIASLAPHSYAYPNAILLHHQLSGGNSGNLTEQREQVKRAEEWSRRLLGPLCKKLNTTQEKFVRDMYRHDSTGDWSEFADRAAELGWVQHVVREVRERGITQLSEAPGNAASKPRAERRDAQGRSYVDLPRLQPFDLWFLHDPDDYYR